ncbi:cytochrome P450 4C1-like isoform X1 [Daktulosphaira vitifoliae]|uniref:cytochrome P450 4C1-like isoform X1 n=1 Tax=Daktulosphaira vitifoliae TaxID=58002 RepID=UPI0021A9B80B|nr:cytochrome P450 4C1-like isoform X1 [Daktulosphaira vitifoliae]XP_050523283.1 cytochrome P450 4C1-like isoform X1 [Daktulosphaira vitifoliae]XP_050523285.1 cytochrome P450 4C1-like isoform X1 [Daktulosphaira vitifoliae]
MDDYKKSVLWSLMNLFLIIGSFLLIFKFNILRKIILANRLPGPRWWYVLKLLLNVINRPESIIKTINDIYSQYEKSLFKIWFGPFLCIVPTKPEDICAILNHPNLQKKGIILNPLRESCVGDNISTFDDLQKWKIHRYAAFKCISFNNGKTFTSLISKEAVALVDYFKPIQQDKTNDCEIYIPIHKMHLKTYEAAIFGENIAREIDVNHDIIIQNMKDTLNIIIYRIFNPWYFNKSIFKISTFYKKNIKNIIILHNYINKLFKRSEIEKVKENIDKTKGNTFIEIMEKFDDLTDEDTRNLAHVFLGAGSDTASITISNIIFLMSYHSDIQNMVFVEQNMIFSSGDPNRRPTYEDLHQMKYLEQVINETLRIRSSTPFTVRYIEEEISVGGYLLPAGSILLICIGNLHKSHLYYKDPEKFNPDNFSPDECLSRHPNSFMPFGLGPRNCVGKRFAMIQMKVIISTLIRNYHFHFSEKYSKPEDFKATYSITQTFDEGCYVKFKQRENNIYPV